MATDEEFIAWLKERRDAYQGQGERYPEFVIDDLIRDYKRDRME